MPHLCVQVVGEERLQRRGEQRKVRTQHRIDEIVRLEERGEEEHRELAVLGSRGVVRSQSPAHPVPFLPARQARQPSSSSMLHVADTDMDGR